jgi:PDZ domain-containing protein
MTRRTITLISAGVVLFALVLVSFSVPLPYVVMSPGLTENTLGTYKGTKVIQISGHKTYPTSGHLDLTTVSVTSPGYSPKFGDVIKAWWDKNDIVIPRDIAYPPSQSAEQVEQQNKRDMSSSQDNAIAAGLAQAGIDSQIEVLIRAVEEGAPADGVLETGDEIRTVDGVRVSSIDAAIKEISSVTPGDQVTLGITRDGKKQDIDVGTKASEDDPEKARVGVELGGRVVPPFDVDITLGADIGGPSAGMMFALAIYDRLTPGSLTGGRHIAGTGTIRVDGLVGPIGGIRQKSIGAASAGASIFLVPAKDCADVMLDADRLGRVHGMQVVRVAKLNDAIVALNALAKDPQAKVPACEAPD